MNVAVNKKTAVQLVYHSERIVAQFVREGLPRPQLFILWNKWIHPIITSHMTDEMLADWMMSMANRKWNYVPARATPHFIYADEQLPINIVDAERTLESTWKDPKDAHILWVTPKGYPRKQYQSSLAAIETSRL